MRNTSQQTVGRTGEVMRWLRRSAGFTSVLGGILFLALLHPPMRALGATPGSSSVTLAWDPSLSLGVVGYRIYYGNASMAYTNSVTVGIVTSGVVPGLVAGGTYYFAITAFNILNVESDPSSEIVYTLPTNSTNAPPTLNPISNVAVPEDPGLQTIVLTGISPGTTNEAQNLTITTVSSNPSLIPAPTVGYTNQNSTGVLKLAPATNAFGNATITVTVNDGATSNNIVTRSFTVTVSPVNEAPTLNTLNSLTTYKNAGLQTVNLTGITSGATNEMQTLTVSSVSSNPSLIPNPTVTYTSPNNTGTLKFTPVTNGVGNATITVTVNDGATSNNIVTRSFTVTVNAVPALVTPTIRITPTKQIIVTATGQVGRTNEILASQNLTNWTVIGTVTIGAGGSVDFTDVNAASFQRRFYRTRQTVP